MRSGSEEEQYRDGGREGEGDEEEERDRVIKVRTS